MNNTIKKLFPLVALSCMSLGALKAQNVAINTSGNAAYVGAILDLSNHNAIGTVGFLPPWVTLTSLTTLSPIVQGTSTNANLSGLLVFNTGGSLASGLYYWTGTAWVSVPGSASTVNANNGLSVGSFTAGYVELGGTTTAPSALLGNSVISGSGFTLDFDLGTYTAAGAGSFLVTNGGTSALIAPLLSVTSTTPGVGANVATALSTLDDNGSFGNGTVNISPASASTTTLTSAYSTVLATPPGVGNTCTLALPSPKTYPRRIYTIVYYGNSIGTINITTPGAGSIILNGAGLATLALTSGAVTLQSDGNNWDITSTNASSSNNGPYFQTGNIAWTTNGTYTYTVAAGITQIEVFLVGGGGGTGKVGGTGGNGGIVTGVLAVSPGEVLTIVVGAGGTAGGTSNTSLGGGGGGTYITSTGTLLCGAGGGGGGAGSSESELIGGSSVTSPPGFGGGGWFSNAIGSLAGGSATTTAGAGSGPGGANYAGYLLNVQSYHGFGLTNNPSSTLTDGNEYVSSGQYSMQTTAFQAATSNATTLRTASVPTNINPNAGSGADETNYAGANGEAVLIW